MGFKELVNVTKHDRLGPGVRGEGDGSDSQVKGVWEDENCLPGPEAKNGTVQKPNLPDSFDFSRGGDESRERQ